ncbi:MAG: cytochrome c-type biogenesis protein CcmH [Thermoanaerobaculia bacterium]
MIFLVLLLLATPSAPDASTFIGAPKGQPLNGPQLEAQTARVASLLRCPVCQGMSIADSPSEMAVNMKRQVHELLARGYTEDQILESFEHSYGQFVLLKPKFQGMNALVWMLPIVILAVGVVIVISKMKKLEHRLDSAAAEPVDPYIEQVRDLVSGGKR